MYAHVYEYVSVYMYVGMCECTFVYEYVYICMYMHMYGCT